jgi:hypothetical protein
LIPADGRRRVFLRHDEGLAEQGQPKYFVDGFN